MVEYVAGALLYGKYDFFKKFIVHQIGRKTSNNNKRLEDAEYAEWGKLKQFLQAFINTWTPAPVTVEPDISDQEAIG